MAKLKEWNMWKNNKSISIRLNKNPIPFGKQKVTDEHLIWYGTFNNAIGIYSSKGWTVEDIIHVIQNLKSEQIQIYLEDDEIGSIDTLYYNPKTKFIDVDITFD